MHLFLIGPGGAGKSTVGEKLAVRLGYAFVDLDAQFCERVANIREYLKSDGYEAYLEQNAALFDALLLERCQQNVVLRYLPDFLPPIFVRILSNATASACGNAGVRFCLCHQRMPMSRVAASLRVSLNADLGSLGIKKRPNSASDFPTIWRWAISRFSQWAHRKSLFTKLWLRCRRAI